MEFERKIMMKEKGLFTFSLLLFTFSAAFGNTLMEQAIRLQDGWNAIHVQVADTNDVDQLFRVWPVEWVALYDPAAFLETRQYSAEASSEGTSRAGYRMWRRREPGLSGFRHVPADSVLVCFVTNGSYECVFYGEPRAPRISWHKSSVDENLNLIGFSTWDLTTTERYFSGLGVGDASFFMFGGPEADKPMVMPTTLAGEMTFENGQVLAVSSTKVSDWSGILNVSPRNGLAFDAEATHGTLEVRNDGARSATVAVVMSNGTPRPGTDAPVPPGLFVRDARDAVTNGSWTAFGLGTTLRRELPAGETWKISFAIDLQQLTEGARYGAILSVRDETPDGSAMCANVPLTAVRDGGLGDQVWPKGVWLASAELDSVSFFLTKEGGSTGKPDEEGMKAAGGKMKVRLPFYVDENGTMTLLQRFWYGRDTNGVLRCFSGAVKESVDPLTDVKRVSSACLPADRPVVATATGGSFGQKAVFDFSVDEKSNVNPMRHAQHPQHDGLTADYLGETPSGDSFDNYTGTVKPEIFSVSNRIEFTWAEHGATSWNPEETLTGELTWEFGGLRHERTIQARGRFSMTRLSPVTMKMR